MQRIGAGFHRGVDHRRAPAELSAEGGALDIELLDCIDAWSHTRVAEPRISRFDAVQQEAVVGFAPARDRKSRVGAAGPRCCGRVCDSEWNGARRQLRELNEVSSVQRKLDNGSAAEYLSDCRALGVDQCGRGGGHRDRFGHLAERHLHVDASTLSHLNPDIVYARFLKAGVADL